MISLPEGWFVSRDELHNDYWNDRIYRSIRIQNGTAPDSKSYIVTGFGHTPDEDFESRFLETLKKDGFINA